MGAAAVGPPPARFWTGLSKIEVPPAVVRQFADGDIAGSAAALAAAERLRKEGLDVRIGILPTGSDPADYLAIANNSLDTFRPNRGLPLIRVYVEDVIAKRGDRMQWIEERVAVLRSVARYLATYPPDQTARHIGWLADALDLVPSTVTFELADAYQRPVHHRPDHVRGVAQEMAF